jgi:hypothetical protein
MSACFRSGTTRILKSRSFLLQLIEPSRCSLGVFRAPHHSNTDRSYATEAKKAASPGAHDKDSTHANDDKRKDTWAEAEDSEKKTKENKQREADRESSIKTKILDASLNHVKTHGWTKLSLSSGAEDLGYISVVSGLFDRGGE